MAQTNADFDNPYLDYMTWHMTAWLRVGFAVFAVFLTGVAVYLIVSSFEPFDAFALALGLVLIGSAVDIAATGLRSALVVSGETLTVRYAFRARQIARADITAIQADSGGVMISYTQGGRSRTSTADAGQGLLNSLGGKLFRRETRTQQITEQVSAWWHTGSEQAQHSTGY